MGRLAEAGANLMTYKAVRQAADPREAQRLIAGALPPVIASVLEPAELQALHQRLQRLPEEPSRARLRKADWIGAAGVCLLVFLSTLPVAVPFIFMHDAGLAVRISNAIAVAMLFFVGAAYGRCIGRSPWIMAVSMVVLGGALVAMTMALGG
jgi:VIT1/CCC1 family predicted Fe2+/Mn2+ transporter